MLNLSSLIVGLLFLPSCGSQVDSGDNSRRHQEAVSSKEKERQKTEQRLAKASGSCFGVVDELTAPLQLFCDELATELKSFPEMKQLLCDERRIGNLSEAKCGWNGHTQKDRYMKVYDSTPLEDTGNTYKYFSAYSLTAPANMNKSFNEMLVMAHSQPELFHKKYGLPANTIIRPIAHKKIGKQDHKIDYLMEVDTSSGRARFQSQMKALVLSDGSTEVILDRSFGNDFKLIRMRENVNISFRLPTGELKLICMERREVYDQAAHRAARKAMKQYDLNRMQMYYDKALIQ